MTASVHGVHPTAAAGFGATAADYERGRPGYPHDVGEILLRRLRLGPGARVCDLGAGTGKFTRLLLERGLDVVAVEPVHAMRAQLAEVLPEVTVLDGTAEAVPVPDGTVDAVTVAQAFHWFRADAALAELRRILRPGGGVALVWNRRDESVPWVRAMSEVLGWPDHPVSSYERVDWGRVLADGGFVDGGRDEVRWEQPMTRELLAARVRSVSYVGERDEAGRQAMVDAVLAVVGDQPEHFPLPYTTVLWWASTPPS
jgi:SAM-dependent methyltransferase